MLRPTRPTWSTAAAIAGLACLGSMPATPLPASAAATVSVNGATTYQRIDGFGISESSTMANAIRGLTGSAQKLALDMLFSTSDGAGFSIIRNDVPSGSDSIEPRSPGSPSTPPSYVWNPSNGGTEDGQLWLAQQANVVSAGYR